MVVVGGGGYPGSRETPGSRTSRAGAPNYIHTVVFLDVMDSMQLLGGRDMNMNMNMAQSTLLLSC